MRVCPARSVTRTWSAEGWARASTSGTPSRQTSAGAPTRHAARRPSRIVERAQEAVERCTRRYSLRRAEHRAAGCASVDGGVDDTPRIAVAEGSIRAEADADASGDQRCAAPEVRPVVGVDLGDVVVAAIGDEPRLRHDGQAEPGDVTEHLVGYDRAVLDAITGRRARPRARRRGRASAPPA